MPARSLKYSIAIGRDGQLVAAMDGDTAIATPTEAPPTAHARCATSAASVFSAPRREASSRPRYRLVFSMGMWAR
jgi:hypothetical protein